MTTNAETPSRVQQAGEKSQPVKGTLRPARGLSVA